MRTIIQTMVDLDCINCGVPFGISEGYRNERQRDHKNFHCPNGHRQHYQQESDVERERRWKNEAQARATRNFDRAETAERSLTATKGHLTRAKKRQAAGVCGFCQRSFKNVRRHVENRHPKEVS